MQLRETGRPMRSIIVLSVVAALLQVGLAPQLSVMGGTLNFMLALCCALALTSDVSSAVYIGFCCGLFFDLTSSGPIGLMALIMTVAGFGLATASRGVMGGLTPESLRLAGIVILLVNLAYGLCLFLMGVQGDLVWALFGHGISSTVLDILLAALFLLVLSGQGPQRTFSSRPRGSRYKLNR